MSVAGVRVITSIHECVLRYLRVEAEGVYITERTRSASPEQPRVKNYTKTKYTDN